MKKIFYFIFLFLLVLSCNNKKETLIFRESANVSLKKPPQENLQKIDKEQNFYPFKADTISNIQIKGFSINSSYKVGENYLVTGYYEPVDGKIVLPDTEQNWGDRLLFLNDKKEIEYKSHGNGDVYRYDPYFYKNNTNDEILVVCQLAYEYFFGGDAYLIKKGKINYLGNIDIESNDMNKTLIDILKIKKNKTNYIFSFDSDSLLLSPGGKDSLVQNNGIRYEYNSINKTFKLIK